jgi:hypothetical protein
MEEVKPFEPPCRIAFAKHYKHFLFADYCIAISKFGVKKVLKLILSPNHLDRE